MSRDDHDAMDPILELSTGRLRLRQWVAADREPFAAMNSDPAVMRYFASVSAREASERTLDTWQAEIRQRGWSNWAVELAQGKEFIGFVGLTMPWRVLPFTPCVEIGWRLAKAHWGHGYATEAAKRVLVAGFAQIGLQEIVSFTSLVNTLYKITREQWRRLVSL